MRAASIVRTRLRWAGLLLAACSLPALAGAQQRPTAGPRVLSVGLGAGGVVPVGDFANDVKTGWQVSGSLQYQPVAEGPWAARVEALYTRSDLTDDAISAGGGAPDQTWTSSILYAGVAAPYFVAGRAGSVRPYIIGGLGLYSQTVRFEDTSGVTQSTTESGFGFNGGAGVRFGRAVAFFIEARFHQFSITPEGGEKSTGQFIPISFGFTF